MSGIKIPEAALVVVAEATTAAPDYETIYEIAIFCGDVIVFERKYSSNYDEDAPYVYDLETAKNKALEEFGNKLKGLLS